MLLKAEVVHLTEGMARLQEECLQHQGKAMGLQELVSEISASGDATTVCHASDVLHQYFGPLAMHRHHMLFVPP